MGLRNEWDNVLDGVEAGEDLSAKPYHFVQMVAGGIFAAATAGQRGLVGVLQNSPNVGEQCIVSGGGRTLVTAGVAITKGASLMSDAAGKAITSAAGVANHIYGYALEAASASGVKFQMVFAYHGPVTNAS